MALKDSTRDKVAGNLEEAKGTIKEGAGKATKDEDLQAEGKGEQTGGKVRKKIGDVKKVFEK